MPQKKFGPDDYPVDRRMIVEDDEQVPSPPRRRKKEQSKLMPVGPDQCVVTLITRYYCANCDATLDEGERRCDGCNKFASKRLGIECPHCNEFIAMEDLG